MKKVDYEHFSRFLMPHSLTARGDDLYFCVKKADMEANTYTHDLYRLRGGKASRLTALGDVGAYRLTEEGIVFPAARTRAEKDKAASGVPQTVFYRLPYDGGEAAPFLTLPYAASGLIPAGEERYFFTAQESLLYLQKLEEAGGDAEKAAAAVKEENENYRVLDEIPFCENGAGFINGQRARLYLYEKGGCRPLTGLDESAYPLSALNGKLLLNVSERKGRMPLCDRLISLDMETLEKEDISLCGECTHNAAWTLPDGRVLALIARSDRHGLNQNASLYIREGGAWRAVYDGGELSWYSSVGSDVKGEGRTDGFDLPVRDGRLYTLDTVWNHTALTAVDIETGEVRRLTDNGMNISSVDFWGEGFAVIAMEGNGGSEVYRVSPEGACERLTDFNTALCAEYEYSAPRRFTFVNEAGTEIEGWVIPPADYDPAKKYPAVLDIHGGPKTVYGACYFHEMQLWSGKGWFVLFCNPTGGDGRGDDFADIFGDYGGQDYRDVMRFTDEALRLWPAIDPERLGVTGGSYGGFMTNWIIGHTHRFKAAASQRSIANWLGFHGTSDIGYYFAPDQVKGSPWTNAEAAWAQSPLRYADKAVTPTLFIHSDEDYRCPLSEGLQMFTALRDHGVEARLCMFRGENHELSRSGKPKHRVRRLKEITEWLERFIG